MESFPENLLLLRFCSVVFLLYGLGFISHQLVKAELSFTLGLFWSAALLGALLLVSFPSLLFSLSSFFGTEIPSNLLFFVSIFFLLVLCFGLTLKVSQAERRIVRLTQALALLEEKKGRLSS